MQNPQHLRNFVLGLTTVVSVSNASKAVCCFAWYKYTSLGTYVPLVTQMSSGGIDVPVLVILIVPLSYFLSITISSVFHLLHCLLYSFIIYYL